MNTETAEHKTLKERYPEWAHYIQHGDFIVRRSNKEVEVEWSNTSVFEPTFKDILEVRKKEFPGRDRSKIKFKAGIMSLTLSGKL